MIWHLLIIMNNYPVFNSSWGYIQLESQLQKGNVETQMWRGCMVLKELVQNLMNYLTLGLPSLFATSILYKRLSACSYTCTSIVIITNVIGITETFNTSRPCLVISKRLIPLQSITNWLIGHWQWPSDPLHIVGTSWKQKF